MTKLMVSLFAILIIMCGSWHGAGAQEASVTVSNAEELNLAVAGAKPGARILLSPGTYKGGFYFRDIHGEPGNPIVIAALDSENPPIIEGGGNCMHLADATYLEIHNLVLSGASGNGINIDDGGTFETPAHHVVLRNLTVRDVGPKGNRDGIKLSGVDDFRVEGCTVERWGSGGSAIDMVGCHKGVIEGCTFRHNGKAGANAVQTKGGSADIAIRRCRFEHAGQRSVNIGGSTGLRLFRPKPQGYEAKDITVEGCVFIGSNAPAAFVGVDGAVFRFNTIYRPRRWVLRILQQTRKPGFVPSRNGQFTDNIIVFRSDEVVRTVNIGPGTAPETFTFARNFWYCIDDPDKSLPDLPSAEENGTYGEDPLLRDPEKGDLRLRPNSPAHKAGAGAFTPELSTGH